MSSNAASTAPNLWGATSVGHVVAVVPLVGRKIAEIHMAEAELGPIGRPRSLLLLLLLLLPGQVFMQDCSATVGRNNSRDTSQVPWNAGDARWCYEINANDWNCSLYYQVQNSDGLAGPVRDGPGTRA